MLHGQRQTALLRVQRMAPGRGPGTASERGRARASGGGQVRESGHGQQLRRRQQLPSPSPPPTTCTAGQWMSEGIRKRV